MTTNDRDKKSYQKPTVTQVKIELGEAVLQACKATASDTSGKQAKNSCTHPGCAGTVSPS